MDARSNQCASLPLLSMLPLAHPLHHDPHLPSSCFVSLPLQPQDLAALCSACSELRHLASQDELWRPLFEREFPHAPSYFTTQVAWLGGRLLAAASHGCCGVGPIGYMHCSTLRTSSYTLAFPDGPSLLAAGSAARVQVGLWPVLARAAAAGGGAAPRPQPHVCTGGAALWSAPPAFLPGPPPRLPSHGGRRL
jgi:hypothetical protein